MPINVPTLLTATQTYQNTSRAMQSAILMNQLAAAGDQQAVTQPSTENTWKDVTAEVNAVLTSCLLEIIYGVESTYGTNPAANHPAGVAGANGPFQLQKATAVEMGLTVSTTQDDRLNFTASANGAARALFAAARILTFRANGADGSGCSCSGTGAACSDDTRKLILVGYNQGYATLKVLRDAAEAAGKSPCTWAGVDSVLEDEIDATQVDQVRDYIKAHNALQPVLC